MEKKDRPLNLVDVKTTTDPPALPIQQAAERVNRHNVFINNKISKGHLDYGYVFWTGEEESSGQKVVILNKKWDDFEEECHIRDMKKGKATHLTLQDAMRESGVSQAVLMQAIIDEEVTWDKEVGKIKKDDAWLDFKKASHLPQ